jgi:hypothetical protein
MDDVAPLTELLHRAREGDETAMRRLFDAAFEQFAQLSPGWVSVSPTVSSIGQWRLSFRSASGFARGCASGWRASASYWRLSSIQESRGSMTLD